MNKLLWPCLCLLLFGLVVFPLEVGSTNTPPPDQAFRFSVAVSKPDSLLFSWDIVDGTYLYCHKFKFVSETSEINPAYRFCRPAKSNPVKTPAMWKFFGIMWLLSSLFCVRITISSRSI
jgi:hypothetical protein